MVLAQQGAIKRYLKSIQMLIGASIPRETNNIHLPYSLSNTLAF
jgi:hypothetical protein